MTTDEPVLEVSDLHKHFNEQSGIRKFLSRGSNLVKAVDGVSLSVGSNEVHGIIGESGCGKTTLFKTIIGLQSPTEGTITYRGNDLTAGSRKQLKESRKNIQMVFQDPFNSLNPKLTVRESILEALNIHGLDASEERVNEALENVQLRPPSRYLDKLPKQLSGGEKQRVSIARAISVEPDVLLADEPVSMLDVSTQAAILRLLSRIADEMEMSIIYISHDLSTVSYLCDFVHVMYLGEIVESAPTDRILEHPKHPYTKALLQAIPVPNPDYDRTRTQIEGVPDSNPDLEGCRFKNRCPERMDICDTDPLLREVDANHRASCHLYYDHHDVAEKEGVMANE